MLGVSSRACHDEIWFRQLEQNFLYGYASFNQYDGMAYKSSLSLIRPYILEQPDDESDEDFDKRWDETAFDYEENNANFEEIINYLNRNTSRSYALFMLTNVRRHMPQ